MDQGCPNFDESFSTWKNWDLALRNIFWSLGCVKNAKNVKIVKNQVFEGNVAISQKWKKIENFVGHSFVYGQRCFEPKNHKDWPYRFGDIATIPSKTWFFTNFTFLAFLTHPNDQKMFQRARSQFFHVLKHQKNFRQNWGTLGPKVFGLAWIQSISPSSFIPFCQFGGRKLWVWI